MEKAERDALATLFRCAQRLLPAAQSWHTAVYGEGPPPQAITDLRLALIAPALESLVRKAVAP